MNNEQFGYNEDGIFCHRQVGADTWLPFIDDSEYIDPTVSGFSSTTLNKGKSYILFMYHTGTPACTGKNCTVKTLATWTSYNSDKTIFLGAFYITNVLDNASYSSTSRSIKCYQISTSEINTLTGSINISQWDDKKSKSYSVTFSEPFSGIPEVIITYPFGASAYGISEITSTGFTAWFRYDGDGSNGKSGKAYWSASL